ncbi:MAG TPA: helix-hairpin-helix domain-containing protein, partial [Steroidobacteraceae bacterium]|nr:helix-hairpin-helix domain-containing protein [Steroidobacteraceae bacterium]
MATRFSQRRQDVDELSQLRNIGKAMRKDFELLGIQSVKQLARCNADKLYAQIQTLTSSRHDPCVWDTYAAAIHQAKTGEALPWWDFTKVRKERELFIPLSRTSESLSRLRKRMVVSAVSPRKKKRSAA